MLQHFKKLIVAAQAFFWYSAGVFDLMNHFETFRTNGEFLRSLDLSRLIDDGHVTIALIRPGAVNNRQNLSETEAISRIIASIQPPLTVLFQTRILFSPSSVEQFYEGISKEHMLSVPSLSGKFPSRWEEFVDMMTQSPTTVLMLGSAGNAVSEWRTQMGDHWDPKQNPAGSIRYEFAENAYNNLTHGSDSKESVRRELVCLIDLIPFHD